MLQRERQIDAAQRQRVRDRSAQLWARVALRRDCAAVDAAVARAQDERAQRCASARDAGRIDCARVKGVDGASHYFVRRAVSAPLRAAPLRAAAPSARRVHIDPGDMLPAAASGAAPHDGAPVRVRRDERASRATRSEGARDGAAPWRAAIARRAVAVISSNMLGGASQTVSKIRVKCNGK